MRRKILFLVGLAALLIASAALADDELMIWAIATNNTVTSTIAPGLANWDPADPVTISGTIRDPDSDPCGDVGPVSDADSLVVEFVSPDPSQPPTWQALSYHECNAHKHFVFTPGSDAYGNFSFSLRGGGVSWVKGDGVNSSRGAWMRLTFWKSGTKYIVSAGDDNTYAVLPGCPQSPLAETVYGQLASCDLNSDGAVDASDLSSFATFLGKAVTLESGWQADYNHSGPPTVDASDLSYFAGRLGKNCNSQKAGDDYAMDVHNLELDYLLDYLRSVGVTKADIVAHWNAMGLSYDRLAAFRILASDTRRTEAAEQAPWSAVKVLYR